ncbi:MAG: recombination regulator RecX [Betaproteobacteria bacterium]|jgi:regulatory protein
MFNRQNRNFPLLSLKSRALRALSQREYSRQELLQKLTPYETQEGELERVLNELELKDFLNEKRHAQSIALRKESKLGVRRIHAEMKQKGVPTDVAASVLEELQTTELARATALWLKKFGTLPLNQKEIDQQMRFMMTRGFSSSLLKKIYALLKEEAPAEPRDG